MKDILIYYGLISSIAEEMGEVLQRSAFSPNIKERRDFSCALFDRKGRLIGQAAHIPVHLGSMAYAVVSVLKSTSWAEGKAIIVNDPYQGGTHLPDVTLILPAIFHREPHFFLAARAHHSDVGGKAAASMGVVRSLSEEGVVLHPQVGMIRGNIQPAIRKNFLSKVKDPEEREGDLKAQWAACELGVRRVKELVARYSLSLLDQKIKVLFAYTKRLMEESLEKIRDGESRAEDYLDNDGVRDFPVKLAVRIEKRDKKIFFDFSESADQTEGPVNTVPPVVASAIFYCLRCLVFEPVPENQGIMGPVTWKLRKKSVLHPDYGFPVSLGNVETSQRLVDLIFRALAPLCPSFVPAASYGTMNNLSFSGVTGRGKGKKSFAFYETLGGGAGAKKGEKGEDAVQCHMTNTWNTPIEVLEQTYPLRVEEYRIRKGSGGKGKYRGGNGIVRAFTFLTPCQVALIGERRKFSPYGLAGGKEGKRGAQFLFHSGKKKKLPGKINFTVEKGDRLVLFTPGGAGWGKVRGYVERKDNKLF